jgi:hypothetical protein
MVGVAHDVQPGSFISGAEERKFGPQMIQQTIRNGLQLSWKWITLSRLPLCSRYLSMICRDLGFRDPGSKMAYPPGI